MQGVLSTMLALERIKRPEKQSYIVYTYVLTPTNTKSKALFIPLYVTSDPEKAKEKAKEIIQITNYSDILTYPMGLWISLGDSMDEKVTSVEIKEYAQKEDQRRNERAEERHRIEEEIKKEQKDILDPETIESYYYDWFCLIQNKSHIKVLKENISTLEASCQERLKNLREKNKLHPEYKDEWQDLLLTRLDRRGERNHAEAIIKEANEIIQEEHL